MTNSVTYSDVFSGLEIPIRKMIDLEKSFNTKIKRMSNNSGIYGSLRLKLYKVKSIIS